MKGPVIAALALLTSGAPQAAVPQPSGASLFAGACAGCHAAGSPRVLSGQPLLPRTRAITGSDPAAAIRIVLRGHFPRPYQRGPWMPEFAPILSDGQIADVLDWLRFQAGQPPWPDLAQDVHQIRATETR